MTPFCIHDTRKQQGKGVGFSKKAGFWNFLSALWDVTSPRLSDSPVNGSDTEYTVTFPGPISEPSRSDRNGQIGALPCRSHTAGL